tara:strand:- start:385 stop:1062 length:678 start_codon:yes stop_codon:yes gene_type:complete
MKYTKIIIFTIAFIIGGCAQVPKEAVELSATVGRDLVEMKKSHTELVKLYYEGLIKDINQFVDDVYLPYQIQKTLSDDFIRDDMISSIVEASDPSASGQSQKDAFEKLNIFHLIIHEEVEAYRVIKLSPIKAQYVSVLDNINKSYDQIHYANSIVTGHLASVVKVHDAQNEILEKVDLKDFRTKVGENTSKLSDEIAELVVKAKEKDADLGNIVSKFEELSEKLK